MPSRIWKRSRKGAESSAVRVVAPTRVKGASENGMVRARLPSPTGRSIRPSSIAE